MRDSRFHGKKVFLQYSVTIFTEKKPELVTNHIKMGANFLKMLNFPIFFR